VTILFAAAAFILPSVAAATASQAAAGTSVTPTSYAPDDTPWN
jgi:hypothetical protein